MRRPPSPQVSVPEPATVEEGAPPGGEAFSSLARRMPDRPFDRPVQFPGLRADIVEWKKGNAARGPDGQRVVLPLQGLYLKHLDFDVDIDDWDPEDSSDVLSEKVARRIDFYTRGLGSGESCRFALRAYFFDPATGITATKLWSGNHIVPASVPVHGVSQSMGSARDLAKPEHWVGEAFREKGNSMMMAHALMRRTMDSLEDQNDSLRRQLQSYQDREFELLALHRGLLDDTRVKAAEDRKVEFYSKAGEKVLEKALSFVTIAGLGVNKWLAKKMNGEPEVSPRDLKATGVLKSLFDSLQKSGIAPDGESLRKFLESLSLPEEVRDRVLEMIQEFALEEMMKTAQRRIVFGAEAAFGSPPNAPSNGAAPLVASVVPVATPPSGPVVPPIGGVS